LKKPIFLCKNEKMAEFYEEKMKDPFQELIDESGHKLHLEVVKILKNNNWQVELSPYYYDEMLERPREIDLVAWKEKAYSFRGSDEDVKFEEAKYKIFLFIECKHIKEEVVFWLTEANLEKIKEAFFNAFIGINFHPSIKELEAEKIKDIFSEHRYFTTNSLIAKLYHTKPKEKGEKHDMIFTAFTSSIHSLIFFRDEPQRPQPGIYYPVIVYKALNKVAVVFPNQIENYQKLEELEEKNLLLEVNYLYKRFRGDYPAGDRRGYTILKQTFLVDFVAKENLEKFLKKIEKESDIISKWFADVRLKFS
jgi:hypothetical protein